MPKFVSVKECNLDAKGDIAMRLDDVSGKFYDLTFDLSFVPSMLILLNHHFTKSTSQNPEPMKDFVLAHQPASIGLSSLPGSDHCLVVNTLSGMQIPLLATPELLTAISEAALHLRAILAAEAQAQQSNMKQ